MPRKARITVPGAVHHVMSRGYEGRAIFIDDEDYQSFLKILESNLFETGYKLYAWALLPNHYHLVIRINENPLSSFMRSLNGRYAQYYRKKNGKKGNIYQDRYKSIVTHDQNYIQELVRYVHLNPLRAGLCKSINALDNYSWCGHSVLMGKNSYKVQDTRDVLRRFSNSRQEYRKFIKEGLKGDTDFVDQIRMSNEGRENIHNSGCWVIGDRDFVQNALRNATDVKMLRAYQKNKSSSIEEIVKKVCRACSVSKEAIMYRGRATTISHARKIIAWLAHRGNNIPVSEIAHYLNVNPSSVSRMILEGEVFAKKYNLKQ